METNTKEVTNRPKRNRNGKGWRRLTTNDGLQVTNFRLNFQDAQTVTYMSATLINIFRGSVSLKYLTLTF